MDPGRLDGLGLAIGPDADLGRAVGAVDQAQRGPLQAQAVQQLAQRLAAPEEAFEEVEAERIGEVIDRLLLGRDGAAEAEGVEDLEERAPLAGLALTFRPDIVLAIGLALLFAFWSQRRSSWKPLLIGLAVGLIPVWVHLVLAGPVNVVRGVFLDPVFHLRAGRELPRPPSWGVVDGALQAVAEGLPPWWGLPAPKASQQQF